VLELQKPMLHKSAFNPLVLSILELALSEDIGAGDITSSVTVPIDAQANGRFLAKQDGVISGFDVAEATFELVDPAVVFHRLRADGDFVDAMTEIATVSGNAQSILTAERVALNFLQRLSGVATMTRKYVSKIEGSGAKVVDTRKTTPGMRALEKESVRHGGGGNHRFGLSDGILIKDNHLAAVGGENPIATAISQARANAPHTLRIEVEVTNLEQVKQALAANADIIMLDNMSIDELRKAVDLIDHKALVEASGGVTLDTIAAIAATGVDLVSVGALTHSAPSLDISLDFEILTA
jgi:nicotinate-nucleotide pyrophosphorylase (carboxylating)